jgi:ABC-2 type transport system permease protein
MQVAALHIQLMRVGRFFQGLGILLWGSGELGLSLFSLQGLVIVVAFVSTAALFYGLYILQAVVCFWSVETLELMNITTFGGLQAGQYPMTVYHPAFRYFFTLLVPIGCVAYYPLATLLQREDLPLWLGAGLMPMAGIVFLLTAGLSWRLGIRRYCSTGS